MPPLLSQYRVISHTINTLNRRLGHAVSWMTLFMVLITVAIVIMRTTFNSNSVGTQELITYFHAAVIMFASAYTQAEQGHVRVDIFYRRFKPHQQAWVDLVGSLIFLLPFALATIVLSWDFVSVSWALKEASNDAGGIAAVFILKSFLIVNGILLALQAIADALHQLIIIDQATEHNATTGND